MTLPQLSPAILIANPGNINPLAHANNSATAAVVGTMAQRSTVKTKSDTVTISREAAAKAAQAEAQSEEGVGAQTKEAAKKTDAN